MNRRDLLRSLLAVPIIGSCEPARRTYSFLWSNPLARVQVYSWAEVTMLLDGQRVRLDLTELNYDEPTTISFPNGAQRIITREERA